MAITPVTAHYIRPPQKPNTRHKPTLQKPGYHHALQESLILFPSPKPENHRIRRKRPVATAGKWSRPFQCKLGTTLLTPDSTAKNVLPTTIPWVMLDYRVAKQGMPQFVTDAITLSLTTIYGKCLGEASDWFKCQVFSFFLSVFRLPQKRPNIDKR